MALTSASSTARRMAKMSWSGNRPEWSACSISLWTRRASDRSLAIISSTGRRGAEFIGPVLGNERPTGRRPWALLLKGLKRVLLALVDGEQLVELGDLAVF